jgi:hypothetical protein
MAKSRVPSNLRRPFDEMSDFDQEHLVAVYLDGKNQIIKKRFLWAPLTQPVPIPAKFYILPSKPWRRGF